MKMFERDGKWNFIDDNNVFVGYDLGQCCCEHASYVLTKECPKGENYNEVNDLSISEAEEFQFDKGFFEEGNLCGLDSGGSATFRLVKDNKQLFLTLFNSHNGYYGHGFESKIGGINWQSGCL